MAWLPYQRWLQRGGDQDGIAFVEYEDELSVLYASWALNNTSLYGRVRILPPLLLSFSVLIMPCFVLHASCGYSQPLVAAPYNAKTRENEAAGHVFVRNLPSLCDENHLWVLFKAAGTPVSVKVRLFTALTPLSMTEGWCLLALHFSLLYRQVARDPMGGSKGFGFVTFDSMAEAGLAVEALHELPVLSTAISVSISHRAQRTGDNETPKPPLSQVQQCVAKATLASRWVSRGMGIYPPPNCWGQYAVRLAKQHGIALQLPSGLTGMKDAAEVASLHAREAMLVGKLSHAHKRQKTG